MSKLNLNPMADWGYVNNSRFRFLSIRNQGGGDSPVPPEPVIPTDRILYTAIIQPTSTWITENCSENVFDESTGEGYLVLKEGVTDLIEYWDEEIGKDCTIFADIDWDVVEGETNILSITIPTQITNIGDYCFSNYYNLVSVTIPDSVTSISDGVFSNCSSLTSITIPDSVTSIGDNAFNSCENLSDITFPNMLMYFGYDVISGTAYYDNLPDGIVYISGWYLQCKGELPTGELLLNPNTIGIGDCAFQGCAGLTGTLILPDSVTHIGDYAFQYCSGITSLTIGNSVTSIGEKAFQYCSGITSLTIGNSVTSIGEKAFQYCSGITSLTIGNSVTSIGNYAFDKCESLAGNLVIPNSVVNIGTSAFQVCRGVTSVTIGNSVTSIGDYAFNAILHLTSVTSLATEVPILGSGNFSANNDILYVPSESVRAYLDDTKWNTAFNGNIQAIQE